jgi:hypothetical protein
MLLNVALKTAEPVPSSACTDSGEFPSRNVTAPVGAPAEEVTVDVSDTTAPACTEPGSALRLVLVGFEVTTTVTGAEVLVAKLTVC